MTQPLRDDRGRWLPGRSPNPAGRPRGAGAVDVLERVLLERENGITNIEALVRGVVRDAVNGDRHARESILRRVIADARPEGEFEGGITIQIVAANAAPASALPRRTVEVEAIPAQAQGTLE